MPQIVQGFAHGASYAVIGLLTALPAILTVAVMPLWGASSDRRNERDWHLRIAMLVAAMGWLLVISFNLPAMRYTGLVLVSLGSFSGLLTFWTFPASAGILFIRAPASWDCAYQLHRDRRRIGNRSTGHRLCFAKNWTGSFTSGLVYVVAMLIMGVICIAIVATQTRVTTAVPSASTA